MRSVKSVASRSFRAHLCTEFVAPKRTAGGIAECSKANCVLTTSMLAAVSMAAARSTISSRRAWTRRRTSGVAKRRRTVRTLTPAFWAACSAVAPQASARSSAVSAAFLPEWAMLSLAFALSTGTSELFPATHNHVAVEGIDLHQEGSSSGLLGGYQRGPAAGERIKQVLTRPRRILDSLRGQFHGFLGEMDHLLGIYFFDRPDVGGIGRTEEAMGGALTPAVETPFVVPHEVLFGQHGVFFHPNHTLS